MLSWHYWQFWSWDNLADLPQVGKEGARTSHPCVILIIEFCPPWEGTQLWMRQLSSAETVITVDWQLGTGWLHGQAMCADSEDPTLALTLHCHHLKIIGSIWVRGPTFPFCIEPYKLCSWSWIGILCWQCFQWLGTGVLTKWGFGWCIILLIVYK